MGEIPIHGLGDAGGEGLDRLPAELAVDLGAINGVAAVVAGAIGDVGDLGLVRLAVGARGLLPEQGADRLHDLDVRFFVHPADVVGLAGAALVQHEPDGAGVVLDIEPVADLHAVTVDRQRFALEGVEDHQRDQLFGEVVGTVVVRAVGRQRGEAVGVLVGADEVVAGGLGGGVGGVGFEVVVFGEGRSTQRERAVDLVGGDVEETEGGLPRLGQPGPVLFGAIEQAERTGDVGLDEGLGRVDGAVHVRLGGKIHHGVDRMVGEELRDQRGIADVAVGENIARVTGEVGEIRRGARVGERVEVDELGEGRALFSEALADEIAADEAAAAGDE